MLAQNLGELATEIIQLRDRVQELEIETLALDDLGERVATLERLMLAMQPPASTEHVQAPLTNKER